MKESEVAEIVFVLVAAYPNWKPSDRTTEVYEAELLDLDYQSAQNAVRSLVRTSRFCPTIAEIREAALETTQGHARCGEDAWGDVMLAMRSFGPGVGDDPAPRFRDPVVNKCVQRFGGWRSLCDTDNETADRARFCRMYDELARAARTDQIAGRQLPEPKSGLLPSLRSVPKDGGNIAQLAGSIGRRLEAPKPIEAPPIQARVVSTLLNRRMSAAELNAALEAKAVKQ